MADSTRPALRLVKSNAPERKRSPSRQSRTSPSGSSIVIEVERGQLRQNLVHAITSEDAAALLSGLAMALVQVVRVQQGM